MLSAVQSYGLNGIIGFPVMVEVSVMSGLPGYETVGLPDAAVRESKDRVRAAIDSSGYETTMGRITVNLAPADTRKVGSVYDLPIALGILAANGYIKNEALEDVIVLGELALSGEVREICGVLPMTIDAHGKGRRCIMVPAGNANEAANIEGMTVIPVSTLNQAVMHLKGLSKIEPQKQRVWDAQMADSPFDFSEVKGQHGAKRAAEIASAGGHNILMIGAPGSGKTMIARRMPTILPRLTFEEALAITKIHSIIGKIDEGSGLVTQRPYRSPHHSASSASLVGGGSNAMPGEVSLAHCGVLFLDEFPEFKKDALEALRQPLEDGSITVSRASAKSTYPADFMLVAAMNPCPCGYFGSRVKRCKCNPYQVQRYQQRISGPMLDRIDMHIEMSDVKHSELTSQEVGESSASIRERVERARDMQLARYKGEGIKCNSQMTQRHISKYCALNDGSKKLIEFAMSKTNMTARAYNRILKVSRSIADLEGAESITTEHVSEAIQYRSIEGKYWA